MVGLFSYGGFVFIWWVFIWGICSIAGLNISVSCVPVSYIVAVITFMVVAFIAGICECLAG
jgi:hypothetical protein